MRSICMQRDVTVRFMTTILVSLIAAGAAHAAERIEVPFESDHDRVYVKGRLDAGDPHVVSYETPIEIPFLLGDTKRTCWLDTGSTVTMHLPRQVGEPLIDGSLEPGRSGKRANTTFDLRRGVLSVPVGIAGNEIDGLEVVVSDKAQEINVGSALLSRYVVTLDQASRLVRIAPPTLRAD